MTLKTMVSLEASYLLTPYLYKHFFQIPNASNIHFKNSALYFRFQ
jgi:hypothetical protein